MQYAAQVILQIDEEIAEKGHFWMETNYYILIDYSMHNRDRERSLAAGSRGPDPDPITFTGLRRIVLRWARSLEGIETDIKIANVLNSCLKNSCQK